MISIIVPVSDRAEFEAMTGASLARQDAPVEIIAVDNTAGAFSCAADVINAAAADARGEWLMFAHQDLQFDQRSWLRDAESWLKAAGGAALVGVAGARQSKSGGDREILSLVHDSWPPQRRGHTAIDTIEPVQTVDECAFFVPRRTVRERPFDRRTCDGWHLYAVDYSLTLREQGLEVLVAPLECYHRSGGRQVASRWFPRYEHEYYRTLGRVLRKHRHAFSTVYSTCGTWHAHRPIILQEYDLGAAWRRLRQRAAAPEAYE